MLGTPPLVRLSLDSAVSYIVYEYTALYLVNEWTLKNDFFSAIAQIYFS